MGENGPVVVVGLLNQLSCISGLRVVVKIIGQIDSRPNAVRVGEEVLGPVTNTTDNDDGHSTNGRGQVDVVCRTVAKNGRGRILYTAGFR